MTTSTGMKPVILAGIVAGVVFLMSEMALLAMTGQSPFGPPRMMAAMVMGKEVLPPPASFDLMIMMVAMAVHLVLSILFAWVFAQLYVRFGRELGKAALLGAVFGLAMYFLNFYVMTNVWPWFENGRGWLNIVTHLIFGVVLAWSIHKFSTDRANA